LIKKQETGWLQGSDCIRLRLDDSIDSSFVAYQLGDKYHREWLTQFATGATMPSLNQDILKLLPIFLPELPEQQAIAEVLSSLDDKIDLLHRQNKTLEALAETLFRQWFVEEAEESWGSGIVKDLISILSGFAFKSSDFVENGEYRLITIKNVQDGYLDLSKTDRLNRIPPRMPDYCLLTNGDTLLSLTGNVGRCCLVNEENLLLNQRVAKLQSKNNRDWAFTYFMFRQKSMRRMLEELAKGTAQANLSPIETAKMEIQIPPIDLLERYSKEATPLLEKVLINKNHIRSLTKLRDTLLPKLMSGDEVRVKF
jgi:type I restriction enzyme S subunit